MIRIAIKRVGVTLCPWLWRRITLWRRSWAEKRHWNRRIADVLACCDNSRLSRVADAGKIINGSQVMHNGLKVLPNGYYGEGITRMLLANRGCHEPQEEVVFDIIVRTMPAGAVMMEVGAYWGFYSMWFSHAVQDAKVFLVEPNKENIGVGQRNFKINGFSGDFTRAYVGSSDGMEPDGTSVFTIQHLVSTKQINRLHLLHADIQGFELAMLHGAKPLLDAQCIDYLFISTHSNESHDECFKFLRTAGYLVLVSVNLDETYSCDGVIVACSPLVTPPQFVHPSRKGKG